MGPSRSALSKRRPRWARLTRTTPANIPPLRRRKGSFEREGVSQPCCEPEVWACFGPTAAARDYAPLPLRSARPTFLRNNLSATQPPA